MGRLGRLLLPGILLLAFALLTAACGGPEPATTPADATVGEDTEHAQEGDEHQDVVLGEDALRGQTIFRTAGCAACHGQNAEGTDIAPALAGHTEAQLRRQLRAPLGIMPVFSPERITESQVGDLMAYIDSLGEAHGHEMRMDIGAEMEMHHRMALLAIEDGNIEGGVHHIQHIIELTEGDHRARMEGALADLEAGNLHDAAHDIQQMLAGVLGDLDSGTTLHLKLALSSVRVNDAVGTAHHMQHFVESAGDADREAGEAILALAKAGNLEEAGHELVELMGAIGVKVEEVGDAHEEGDAHEGTGTDGQDSGSPSV